MSELELRDAAACRWQLVALGEVMLRLDPGEGRIQTARSLQVWEGGGEYNVARGLRSCFGMPAAIVTALVDNPIGRLVESLIQQGGVEQAHLKWMAHDGVGQTARNGLNFTERGFGVRPAVGCSDRGHTAVSKLQPGEIDWHEIFGCAGARWFHCGGIFTSLGPATAAVAAEAMSAARAHGTIVSYDLNFRPSLWLTRGGSARANEVNKGLVEQADVLFGNPEGFAALLGYERDEHPDGAGHPADEAHEQLLSEVLERHPGLALAAGTVREVHSASINSWTGICHSGSRFCAGPRFPALEILDRIGGGDAFAAGVIYGLLSDLDVNSALAYGVCHGALAMTTPGDGSMARLPEVQRLVEGGRAQVAR